MGSIVRRALVGIAALLVFAVGGALLLDASIDRREETAATSLEGRTILSGVTSWGHMLQQADIGHVAAGTHDLVVVDEALLPSGAGQVQSNGGDIARLKLKPDGQRRLVISYLSIGEAEDTRSYWQSSWVSPVASSTRTGGLVSRAVADAQPAHHRPQLRLTMAEPDRPVHMPATGAPAWLGPENVEWRGNFSVRFWDPGWKAIVFGHPDAMLDRIIAAGFDGIYLDRADVYGRWSSEHPTAKADMEALVREVATYARLRKPGFLVMMQNAEALLSSQHVRDGLDGVAKQDLLFGAAGEGQANAEAEVDASLRFLRMASSDGIPVLVVEHLRGSEDVMAARRRLEAEGFIAQLDGLRVSSAIEREH